MKHSILIITILFGLITSCNKSNKKTESLVNKWLGKQLTLPSDSLIRNYDIKFSSPLTKKIKILTLIDGDCSICYNELEDWKKFMKKIDTSEVGAVFTIYSYDGLSEFNQAQINFPYPYFQDNGEKILNINEVSQDKFYKTFLLDEDNKVILVGNPNIHEKISELYLAEIKKRTK